MSRIHTQGLEGRRRHSCIGQVRGSGSGAHRPRFYSRSISPSCLYFSSPSYARLIPQQQMPAPFTNQQALYWADGRVADSLFPLPENRVPYAKMLEMVKLSTAVVESILPGPPETDPPFLSIRSSDPRADPRWLAWAGNLLDRDARKREMEEATYRARSSHVADGAFLRTFGHKGDVKGSGAPFLKVGELHCLPTLPSLTRRSHRSCLTSTSVG